MDKEARSFFERKERVLSSTALDSRINKNFAIICQVIQEGIPKKHSSLSVRNKEININCDKNILSAKDIMDINKCLSLDINIFSFRINKVENVFEIKEIIGEEELEDIKIFGCLETKESVINFDSIIEEVDGIVLNNAFRQIDMSYREVFLS